MSSINWETIKNKFYAQKETEELIAAMATIKKTKVQIPESAKKPITIGVKQNAQEKSSSPKVVPKQVPTASPIKKEKVRVKRPPPPPVLEVSEDEFETEEIYETPPPTQCDVKIVDETAVVKQSIDPPSKTPNSLVPWTFLAELKQFLTDYHTVGKLLNVPLPNLSTRYECIMDTLEQIMKKSKRARASTTRQKKVVKVEPNSSDEVEDENIC